MKLILKNQKIEIFILMLGIIFGVAIRQCTNIYCYFSNVVVLAFDSDRLSLVVNAVAIILGIYIAVITILATSVLGITVDMLEKKKDVQLLHIVFSGMTINIVTVFFCVLFEFDTAHIYNCLILLIFLIIAFVSFLKFMHLIYLIFQANFNQMAKDITSNKLEKEEFLTILKQIEQKISTK